MSAFKRGASEICAKFGGLRFFSRNNRRFGDFIYLERNFFNHPEKVLKMAITTNKLSRQGQTKSSETAALEQQIVRLEEDVRKLKIDFDIFFNGGTKRAPHEARGRVEATIKRIADDRNLAYAQRFHFNTVVARFTSYRELWRRMLKQRNEPGF
jgi:hypothetical protein